MADYNLHWLGNHSSRKVAGCNTVQQGNSVKRNPCRELKKYKSVHLGLRKETLFHQRKRNIESRNTDWKNFHSGKDIQMDLVLLALLLLSLLCKS
jgi:hypothetical protein